MHNDNIVPGTMAPATATLYDTRSTGSAIARVASRNMNESESGRVVRPSPPASLYEEFADEDEIPNQNESRQAPAPRPTGVKTLADLAKVHVGPRPRPEYPKPQTQAPTPPKQQPRPVYETVQAPPQVQLPQSGPAAVVAALFRRRQ